MANINEIQEIIKATIINNKQNIKSNLATFNNATTEKSGIIRIATTEEVKIGKDKSIAVTPYTLSSILEKFIPIEVYITDGSKMTLLKYSS